MSEKKEREVCERVPEGSIVDFSESGPTLLIEIDISCLDGGLAVV